MRPRLVVNRRRFCTLLPAAPFALAAITAPVRANGDDGATPEADYETGTRFLKNGRSYLKAIAALERAVQAKPNNAAYQSALGCAYAARFASVCCALRQEARYPINRDQYLTSKAKWDATQTDPRKANNRRLPPPPVLLLPATPDDRVPFALGKNDPAHKKETNQILLLLGRKSLAAFDAAHRLASALPDEARATVEYERGWGLFLLWREGREQEIISEKPLPLSADPSAKMVVAPADICDAFKICTGANGEKAAYWHSLALAHVPLFVAQSGLEIWGGQMLYSADVINTALAAFDRALALKPRDFDLLFQSALVMSQTQINDAVSRLEQAARRNNRNAVLWNLAAALHEEQSEKASDEAGKNAEWEKKLTAMEQGNRAAGYEKILFTLPVPPLLRAAWVIRPVDGFANDVSLLAMLVSKMFERGGRKSDAEIRRTTAALMGVGKKALQSLLTPSGEPRIPLPDLLGSEEDIYGRFGMGFALCAQANQMLNAVQQSRPDEANARLLREFAPIMAWATAINDSLAVY